MTKEELFGNADPKLLKKFKAYHLSNPDVYSEFRKYAHRMKSTGRPRYSAWCIFNVIRWHTDLKTSGVEFKISNDYIALYPRLLIYNEPEFEGFFSIKAMKPCRVMARE